MSEFSVIISFIIVKQMYAVGRQALANQSLHLIPELRKILEKSHGLLKDYRCTIKLPTCANNLDLMEEKA